MSGMNTEVKKLFGDIVAEQTEKGTYMVRKGDKALSPYEYATIKQLTPKCYRLFRIEGRRWDILFANGAMEFGFEGAYVLEKLGKKKKGNLIGVMIVSGTGIYSESGAFLAFISGLHHIAVVDGVFLAALIYDFYGKIYTMCGDFLAEGFMEEAIKKAKQKAGIFD